MKLAIQTVAGIALATILSQVIALYVLGQPPICECGYVKVWENTVLSTGNSQHIADWYSFSHVVHGFLFYALLALFAPRMSARFRLLLALGIEAGWEVFENTPMVIEHYRQQALAVGYTGDSIINSVMDTVFMAVGFIFAWRFPWWATVLVLFAFELFTLVMIRDNLTLNIVNLLYPLSSIAEWQAASGIK